VREAIVIGGGLAGCEAAYQLAWRGIEVTLYEMRPTAATPFHATSNLAELICSNSLKSEDPVRGPGMLKAELAALGSLLVACAKSARIPAGAALAVDRERFSQEVEAKLLTMPNLTLIREPVTSIKRFLDDPSVPLIIATGPATYEPLFVELGKMLGEESLYFYDATAPIISGDSLDMSKLFLASRYGKGAGNDYLNAPMDETQFRRFRQALLGAELAPLHEGDTFVPFEGCLPIEELARRSEGAMRFGPLRPVGLWRDGAKVPGMYAAVQLRREDALDKAWSMVGFQTRMSQGAQKEVFGMIPGLENARFIRFGRMHRNNYICAPRHLLPTLQMREHPHVFFAGQITGLEGYVAAMASGLAAGVNAARVAAGDDALVFPMETALGGLLHYMASANPKGYAPTAFMLSMLPPMPGIKQEKLRREAILQRSQFALAEFLSANNLAV
jgi:methylenetetrahydrofolate--tRNA-(uracil-5-)-methyltransferase